MKALKLFISVAIFASCFTGCEDDNRNEEEFPQDAREELLLSAEIGSAVLTGVETKADPLLEAFENKEFELIVQDHNTKATLTTSLASTVDSIPVGNKVSVGLIPRLYWDDLGGTSGDLDLVGVYPRNVNLSSGLLTWAAETDQSTETKHNSSDLLLAHEASYTYQGRRTPANLIFYHALTKITINLGGNLLSVEQLAAATVKINGVVVSGKVSLLPTSGITYNYTENTTKTDVDPFKTTLSTGNYAYSYAAIVYPFTKAATTEDARVTIATITVPSSEDGTGTDTNTYYVKLPKEEKKFNAGENNVYNVSINKTDVVVTATVVNWIDVGNVDLTSKLSFEVGTVTIDQDAGKNITITEGSVLYVSITDDDEDDEDFNPAKHSTAYVLQSDKVTWKLKDEESPIYWDDLAKPYESNKVTALLILDGDTEANRKDGDKIFTSTTTLGTGITTPFTLNPLTHPTAKFTIKVLTSGESAEDRINLEDIQSIAFATGWNTFAINSSISGIEETETSLTGIPQGITKNVEQSDGSFKDEAKYIAYIAPPESSQGTLNNICTVVVKTNKGITNRYAVNLGSGTVTEFTAGNHYQYKVTITKTQITFTGTVVPWSDQKEVDIPTQL